MQCRKCQLRADSVCWENCHCKGKSYVLFDVPCTSLLSYRLRITFPQLGSVRGSDRDGLCRHLWSSWRPWRFCWAVRHVQVSGRARDALVRAFVFWGPANFSHWKHYYCIRQTLAEFNPHIPIYLVRPDGMVKITNLNVQLPEAFSPKNVKLKFYNGNSE